MKLNKKKYVCPALLSENVWLLGNYFFNLYLIQGSQASALVEIGISAITDEVIAQLESLEISPAYLIPSHPHTDHITGLEGLRKQYPDAQIVAAQGAKEFTDHPKALHMMTKEDRYMAQMLSAWGIRPGRPPIEKFSFPENHIIVKDRLEIDLGGITLHCIKVKGHSPGNIIVHIPEKDMVMVSDSLGFHYPGRCFFPTFFTAYADYLATVDHIISLKPAMICPAHQDPVRGPDVEKAFRDARKAAVDIYAKIIREENKDQTARELFNLYYKDEFTIYSEENIRNCVRLLIRRAWEAAER
ncbi:MAG: MBL fold metallo-hydrolase [Desulfococcaceae bacterium]|jgi:glyoxylase-like metal-dependent hydrolase (beta-lactamase superfamily II)|nr:MBL fold metallo-hydrolase [Desulfococcaceae bacterium]